MTDLITSGSLKPLISRSSLITLRLRKKLIHHLELSLFCHKRNLLPNTEIRVKAMMQREPMVASKAEKNILKHIERYKQGIELSLIHI